MNAAQHRAVTKVEAAKQRLDPVHGELAKAGRALDRAKALLRREIRVDPDAWNTLAEVPS